MSFLKNLRLESFMFFCNCNKRLNKLEKTLDQQLKKVYEHHTGQEEKLANALYLDREAFKKQHAELENKIKELERKISQAYASFDELLKERQYDNFIYTLQSRILKIEQKESEFARQWAVWASNFEAAILKKFKDAERRRQDNT